MENRLEEAERIVKEMQQDSDMSVVEELIKDNQIIFDYKDKKYRVRLLNLSEKEELDTLRRRKFGQLIKDKDVLFEKDLIVQYKERGVNIDEIDEQIKKLQAEDNSLQFKLGEAIAKNEPIDILKNYEEKIAELRVKSKVLVTQRNMFLEFSFENAVLGYIAQVITYLSLDINVEGTWIRVFNNIEDFQKSSEDGLINKSAVYSMMLQYA